jgi:hypothetical protein
MGADPGLMPATPGETSDHLAVSVSERWSRRRLLHLLLVATLVLSLPTIVASFAERVRSQQGLPASLVAGNLIFFCVVALLVVVNGRGYTLLASWVFCAAIVLNGSESFALAQLDRRLVMYAVPVVLAAFLLRPLAAFDMYVLSFADYLVAYWRHAGDAPFNWFAFVVLLGVACLAWLTARRTAWFEQTEDVYRAELDLAVTEREELERQVEALRAELSVGREDAHREG